MTELFARPDLPRPGERQVLRFPYSNSADLLYQLRQLLALAPQA